MSEDKKRSGKTIITSVSVSEEFQKIIRQHNLKPTECFRRGVAVTLCDLGVDMYQSAKNEERLKYMTEFLKKLDEDEKMAKDYKQMKQFDEIRKHLKAISKIAENLDNE